MFKIGDKVKCVNNKNYEINFTLGKIYEVSNKISRMGVKTNIHGVVIKDDYGDFIWTFNKRWKLTGDKVKCVNNKNYEVLERAKQKENDMFACAISKNTISVFSNGTTLIMDSTNRNFETVKEYLKEGGRDINYLEDLFSKEKALSKYLDKEELVKIEYGEVYYNGEVLHGVLVKRILDYQEEGLPTKPLVNFLKNLMENPSYKSREALYNFLEQYNTPLTDDGHFICWKNVRKDFKDIHSGTFDNSPGSVVEMPREKVDDDSNRTCSAGLHACASVYLNSFYVTGSRTVAVKINPKDVVAVPTDYNSAKMRVCRYEVLNEVSKEEVEKIENSQYYNDFYDNGFYDNDYGDYY